MTWPAIPYAAWNATRETLHAYTQVVGKVRLALTPRERAWANVPLYVTARGLTTSAIAYGERVLQIDVDFVAHVVAVDVSDGGRRTISLLPARSVAAFYAELMEALHALGVAVRIWPMQVEVPNPVRLDDDASRCTYDPDAAQRFWQALVRVAGVFAEFRAPFTGPHSPVQFFWGTFDLAYVRYTGRPVTPPAGADSIFRWAGNEEQTEVGFWPGDARFPDAAFFAFKYPKPEGIERATLRPPQAAWNAQLGEFLLRYDDVRRAASPREALLAFLQSAYDACSATS